MIDASTALIFSKAKGKPKNKLAISPRAVLAAKLLLSGHSVPQIQKYLLGHYGEKWSDWVLRSFNQHYVQPLAEADRRELLAQVSSEPDTVVKVIEGMDFTRMSRAEVLKFLLVKTCARIRILESPPSGRMTEKAEDLILRYMTLANDLRQQLEEVLLASEVAQARLKGIQAAAELALAHFKADAKSTEEFAAKIHHLADAK